MPDFSLRHAGVANGTITRVNIITTFESRDYIWLVVLKTGTLNEHLSTVDELQSFIKE